MELQRIKTAVAFLKDGQSFKVGDLCLGVNDSTNLYVTGWSQYSNIENLTKHQALKELNEIKFIFMSMVDASHELKTFIQGKNIKFNLALNCGMGAIGVCSEKDGEIKWETELN